MSKIKRIGTSRVAIATMAAVLAASGAAVAASDSKTGDRPDGQRAGQHGPGGHGGGPGGPGGPMGKYLTYSETHSYKRGKETVNRMDAGKITAVSGTSITLSERDGNSVTRELDSDTDFHVRGDDDATAADFAVGDSVIVSGEKDAAADMVGKRK